MPQPRQEPALFQRPHRALLVGVDDDGVAGLAIDDERDDAVVARVGAGHHALAAIDDPIGHARSMAPG
jgi:hypothetical protein